jgi:hypothetical protein
LGVAGACGREEAPPPIPDGALGRAQAAAGALGGELQRELFGALEEGGPLLAVDVCSVRAQEISAGQSSEGLTVRRVSLRTRNPLNRPDPYETLRLETFAAAHAAGDLPAEEAEVVVEDEGPVLRFLRPIMIAEPCLACHGDPGAIDPAVLELIRTRYPEDLAVGYSAGELRGAISVRVLLEDLLEGR